MITSSRRRRRLATITMLFGYIYAVAIVSMIINALLAFEKSGDEDPIRSVLTLVGGVAVLLLAKRLPFVRDRFEAMIRRLASRVMFSAASNPLLVLDYYGDSAIVEIRITDLPEPLVGKTLAEGPMKTEYGLLVFAIKRAGETRHDVGPTDVLQTGDRIVLFGSLKSVHALFRLKPSFSVIRRRRRKAGRTQRTVRLRGPSACRVAPGQPPMPTVRGMPASLAALSRMRLKGCSASSDRLGTPSYAYGRCRSAYLCLPIW